MTPIVNERFVTPVGFQTSGGPVWKSDIYPLASGAEARNALWARPLRKWQVSGVPLSEADAQSLIRFFNARSGATQGFRFRDPFGHSSAAQGETITPSDQRIGEGDGTETRFQLLLDDGASVPRTVTRPVAASVRLAVDGVETAAFTLDETTGEFTLASAPPSGAIVTAGFEFDLPVRFETDQLSLSYSATGACQLVQLKLIELREGV